MASPESTAALARTHLGDFESLFHAPAIPPEKEAGARAAYERRIPSGEPIVTLYDATFFGGADDGFVITPHRFGWKNLGRDPRVIPWEALDAGTLVFNEFDQLEIMGEFIVGGADLLPLLLRLQAFLCAKVGAPAPSRPLYTDTEIATLARTHLQSYRSVFFAPSIPDFKERGARASYGARIPTDEPLLALYDATVLGGADDGFVITPRRFGWKDFLADPETVLWDDLDANTLKLSGLSGLCVMDGRVSETDDSVGLVRCLRNFLRAMSLPVPATTAAPSR